MGIQVALHHRTQYLYERLVSLGPHIIQLRPAAHGRTPILSYSLAVLPVAHRLTWQFDALSNHVARVIFPDKTAELVADVNLKVDLTPWNPFDFVLEPAFETFPFAYSPELARDLEPYRSSDSPGTLLYAFIKSLPDLPQPTVSFLVSLNERVRDEIRYTTRLEHGVQSSEETLSRGSGSCRDSAWLLVQLFRHFGLAARFVSGYLIQLADNDLPAAASGRRVDSADLHAWAEIFLPGAGWLGLDPTSGLLAAEGHIPLCCSPTPSGAAAIGGTVEPARVEFTYSIEVHRLDQARDLSKPYSDQEWAEVRELAYDIDRELKTHDVRLTMGGEPTFVGIDEAESPEWNIQALGPLKKTLALQLIRSLRMKTAPGALLHLGQGKWYPGEPLPRWAFHCVSRLDGIPVWENGDLFAREDHWYGFGDAEALTFLRALARRLQVSAENILPAFDPQDDAGEPAGYILPLRRRQPNGELAWSSQLWFERPQRFVLFPGDSPVGYRIPVDLMPWVAPESLVYQHETDEGGEPLPDRVRLASHPARRPDLFLEEPTPDPPASDSARF